MLGTRLVWPGEVKLTADVRVVHKKPWTKLVVITVESAQSFPEWAEGDRAASKVVEGLGDIAYVGPRGGKDDATVIAFRKGPRAVRIISAMPPTDARHVSEDKLLELAKLMASRMP